MLHETYQGVYTANRVLASVIIALTGGATWVAIAQVADPKLGPELIDMVRLTTAAAMIGGLCAAPLFGRRGLAGLFLMFVGAVLGTAIGAALAAMVIDPVGLIFGPIFVISMTVQSPVIATVWTGGMLLAHLAAEGALSPESSGLP